MELAQERRGEFKEMKYIAENRASILYELPLAEVRILLVHSSDNSNKSLFMSSIDYVN